MILSRIAFSLFIAGLVGLLIVATLSSSLMMLYVALAIFLACSLLWISLQLFQGRTAPLRWVIAAGVGSLLAGSALLAWNEWIHSADGLPLIGGTLCYLGLGWLVEWMRRADLPWWPGVVTLLVGFALLIYGLLSLLRGHSSGSLLPLVGLGLAALILVPIGLNLVSESTQEALMPNERPPGQRITILASGLLLIAAVIIAIGLISHSWQITLIAAACGLVLITAIASDTHADIVIVLSVLALLAAAPPEVSVAVTRTPGAGVSDLLALGDSYMSGEGAATFIHGTDDSHDQCRRAPTAYAVLSAGPGRPFDHATFLACSGARTFNVVASSADPAAAAQNGEPGTQVDQVRRLDPSYRPKLVIVSLGGNDAGFSTIGETCLAPGNCNTQRALFEGNLPTVRAALVSAYASIRAAVPHTPIVAVPYPQPLANERRCGEIALSYPERSFIREFLAELNATVKSAAGQAGLYYMETMQNALADEHLQLCDPANLHHPGLNFVDLESISGLADQRFNPGNWLHNSLHPNERGHRAMLAAFNTWLHEHAALPVTPPARATAPPAPHVVPGAAERPNPPCSMNITGNSNCKTKAAQWVEGQILDLWPYSIVVLIGLIGIWMISVSLLSLLRASRRNT
jgi:lysophospholipase L1-like esterase